MNLKHTVDNLDAVPEALREYYAESEGKFLLAVEGLVPKARLDEFRTNNINLERERNELVAKFDGIDPEAARELIGRAQKERDKKLIDAGKVDELVEQRVGAMRSESEGKLKAASVETERLKTQLESLLIDGAIRDASVRAGVRAQAIEDVLLRGRNVFRLVEGKAVPMQGDAVVYGKTGEAMTMDEWLGALTANAPHLFEQSRGGGAPGGAPGPGGTRRVSPGDDRAFLENLSDIATGKVRVA